MTMFPGFPVLFPGGSQVFPVESWCSRYSASPATITVDAMRFLLPYVQPPGTLGTFGTALRRHALASDVLWNKSGNARNTHAAPRRRIRGRHIVKACGEGTSER
jgi:hypothetical protein